jgi:anaerobic dimethyl sulfoxide reductase subunit A
MAHIEGGKVVKITNNPNGNRYMAGCVKGLQMARLLYAPDRLRKPLIRTGTRGLGEFREAEWDEALDLVASKLREIKLRYGCESIIRLGSAGTSTGALHDTSNITQRFLASFGGFTDVADGFSSAAAKYVTPFILGTKAAGIDPGTLRSSGLIILWGANISEARLEGALEAHVREARNRGIEVIFIDPRRTLTAKTLATRWIPIRPGTDVAMMMAVLYVLVTENMVNHAYTEKYSYGFDKLIDHVLGRDDGVPKTPAWAEAICGTPAIAIVELSRKYGKTHPTAIIPGLSIQRTLGGEEAIRMSIALQVATGNLGVEGGSSGALTWGRLPTPRMGRLPCPSNPADASVTVYRWADAVLEGRKGGFPTDIKAIYNVGGNYLSTASDTRKVIKAYQSVEFSVCHEFFLTPTAKYCDIVLPAATFLERNDVVIPDGGNHLLFSHKVAEPQGESKTDYDIFCLLAEKLGFLDAFSEGRTEAMWLRKFITESEVPDSEEFKRKGIYFGADQYRVALSSFIADPELNPLKTPSGKVQIYSEAYADSGYSPVPSCRVAYPPTSYPLRLISPKSRFRVHSMGWNIPFLRERERHALWIHPSDAEARGIADGDEVNVSSPQGTLRIPAMVTEDIAMGVICILEGVWPIFDVDGVETSGAVNVLTSTVPTQPSQGSRTHTVFVQVDARKPAPIKNINKSSIKPM